MRTRDLKYLFEPASVAVIGADDSGTGELMMRNLLNGGFRGPIMPVSARQTACAGVLAYPDIARLPQTSELAILCGTGSDRPGLITELGRRGTRAVTLADGAGEGGHAELLDAARDAGVRLLGPDSLGVMVPGRGLNASTAHIGVLPGRLALVAQSPALVSAVLDWARRRRLGFSHVIALGDTLDVGFADVMDYLASDFGTNAVLLCIESLRRRDHFVAAARALARNKPVIALRSGHASGPKPRSTPAPTYAAALVQHEDVFDAVLRRAGILRVNDLDEMFAAARTLNRGLQTGRGRLAMVTNAPAAAELALDTLRAAGLEPAQPSTDTTNKLRTLRPAPLPECHAGIVDVGRHGSPERYRQVIKALLDAPEIDTTLVLHVPGAHEDSEDVARELIAAAGRTGKRRLLAVWMGEASVDGARRLLSEAGIAGYETAGAAVRAFVHLVNHRRNRDMLMETPPLLPEAVRPQVDTARRIIESARPDGAQPDPEAMQLLAAYGIPTVQWETAATPDEAAEFSRELGYPIALTLRSPEIARIRDVGGIALYLDSADAVRTAARRMLERAQAEQPDAQLRGFVLRRMKPRPNARQLFLGVTTDPLFGPVIVVGEGGRAVEAYREHAVGLPPLNLPLARDLLSRTRAWKTLQASPARPDADIDAICMAMVNLSELIVDFPELAEADINPFFADVDGVTVASAHLRLMPQPRPPLAIRPYPKALEELVDLRDGQQTLLRPVRPEDEPLLRQFFAMLSAEDLFTRFFREVRELEPSELARMTQIDYEREMAFLAIANDGKTVLGEVRAVTDPDNTEAEFAVTIRSDLKGSGLGRLLMEKMIRHCQSRGTQRVQGSVLKRNQGMRGLARALGMTEGAAEDPDTVIVEMTLTQQTA